MNYDLKIVNGDYYLGLIKLIICFPPSLLNDVGTVLRLIFFINHKFAVIFPPLVYLIDVLCNFKTN